MNKWTAWAGQGWPKAWREAFGMEDGDTGWPIRDEADALVAVATTPEAQAEIVVMKRGEEIAREACGYPEGTMPSEGRSWVEELAGLLRVTRGQRDNAETRIGDLNVENLREVAARKLAEKEIARLKEEVRVASMKLLVAASFGTACVVCGQPDRPGGHPECAEKALKLCTCLEPEGWMKCCIHPLLENGT